MTDANELFEAKTPIGADLEQGLKTISYNQMITFRLYGRVILPIDGYAFWVLASALAMPAAKTSGLVSAAQLEDLEEEDLNFEQLGSLHYSSDARQEEAETYTANRVIFTSTDEVQPFQTIAPGTIYIGEFDGFRFAFSSMSSRYKQAGIWHYVGFAIFPDMETQIVDDPTQLSAAQVVTNSLPAWLQIAGYTPPWAFWGPPPILFPSFVVPDNERPPFGAVHIIPEETRALASAPTIDPATSTSTQLARDSVRVTLWGTRNNAAIDFLNAVYDYSSVSGNFGIMNVPSIRDEKRLQSELNIIGQKKVIDFEVSYLQHRMNTIAQKLIQSVTIRAGLTDRPGSSFPIGPLTRP